MKKPTSYTEFVNDPANAVATLLQCAEDCIKRAGDEVHPKTWDSIKAAYVDQQCFRAIAFLAKVRAIAVTKHGIPGLVNLANDEAFHPDEVIELAPVSVHTAGKGGVQ